MCVCVCVCRWHVRGLHLDNTRWEGRAVVFIVAAPRKFVVRLISNSASREVTVAEGLYGRLDAACAACRLQACDASDAAVVAVCARRGNKRAGDSRQSTGLSSFYAPGSDKPSGGYASGGSPSPGTSKYFVGLMLPLE